MKDLVEAIAKALVDHPEQVQVAAGMKIRKRLTLEILE